MIYFLCVQKAISILPQWCNNWRTSPKSNQLEQNQTYSLQPCKNTSIPMVEINNSETTVCNETNFLGFTFDRKHLFNKLFSEQQNKATFRLHMLNLIHSGNFEPSQN